MEGENLKCFYAPFLSGVHIYGVKNKPKINSRLKSRRHLINWVVCHLLREMAASAQQPILMKQLLTAERQAV